MTDTSAHGVLGRLAPTPSAGLHIGNIFACLVAWLDAKSQGGEVLLRIEDLDPERSKQIHIDAILRDLELLGLTWDNADIVYQSERTEAYERAYERLEDLDLVYPCYCTRADLHAASAPHVGEKYLYAGTCRYRVSPPHDFTRQPAARLIVPDDSFAIQDVIQGAYRQNLARECGDFIIRRSDGVFSYQLAVVVDDLAQGVTDVVRGIDLLDSAPQQNYLRSLLAPEAASLTYAHIPLLLDERGRKLSKRDHDLGLPGLLEHFKTVPRLLGHLCAITGLREDDEPIRADELIHEFSFEPLRGKQSLTWHL